MFDVFYTGPRPNLFAFELEATDIKDAASKSKTEFFWLINGHNDYTNFNFDWVPDKEKVFHSAGTPELLDRFKLEVGYAFVEPSMRSQGVGIQVLRTMRTKMPAGVFATTRENNTTINAILKFAGFRETGEKYSSARGDYNLILWTK